MSKNINCLTAQKFSTLNSTSNYNRRSAIRRRLELNSTTSNPIENSNNNIYRQNQNSNNSITSPILIYNRHNSRQSSVNLNSSYTNPQSQFHNSQNSQTISINNDLSTSYRRRHLNRNIFISVHKNKKSLSKKLSEIEEEEKKEEKEEEKRKRKPRLRNKRHSEMLYMFR